MKCESAGWFSWGREHVPWRRTLERKSGMEPDRRRRDCGVVCVIFSAAYFGRQEFTPFGSVGERRDPDDPVGQIAFLRRRKG